MVDRKSKTIIDMIKSKVSGGQSLFKNVSRGQTWSSMSEIDLTPTAKTLSGVEGDVQRISEKEKILTLKGFCGRPISHDL